MVGCCPRQRSSRNRSSPTSGSGPAGPSPVAPSPEGRARPSGDGATGDGPAGPDPLVGLERFLEERWRGQHPTIWGDQARQALLNHAIYRGIFDLRGGGVPDEAAAANRPETEPGTGDPTQRVGDELVGDSNGRTSSRGGPPVGRAGEG